MALTQLSDVVYGPLFVPSVIEYTNIMSTLRTSGIAVDDPEVSKFANSAGDTLNMPYWLDIIGESNVSSDDPTQIAVPQKVTEGRDIATKIRRTQGFSAANLAASLIAEDPLSIVAQLIAGYWVREEQKILLAELAGVFASTTMENNLLDATGTANPLFAPASVAAAFSLLGDQGGGLAAIMMHSAVYWNLVAARALTVGRDPITDEEFTDFQGKRVIVNDQMPKSGTGAGTKYTSYLFAPGAIAYAECTGAAGPKKPVDVLDEPTKGNGEGIQSVWYRRHWVMHPRGIAWAPPTPTVTETPANSDLIVGANWNRVYDPKNIRIVALITTG